jgi:hypothetical protein
LWSEHILPDASAFVKKLLVWGMSQRYKVSGSGPSVPPTLTLPRRRFASGRGQVQENHEMNK